MANGRGNMYVITLKKEIKVKLDKLRNGYINERARRQLADGERFLEMTARHPYATCLKVSDLISTIKRERDKKKRTLEDLEKKVGNYQIPMFENYVGLSKEHTEQIKKQCQILEEEVRWLHKCLGICNNEDYFN